MTIGIKYNYRIVQPSPPPIYSTLFIIPNGNSVPIKN